MVCVLSWWKFYTPCSHHLCRGGETFRTKLRIFFLLLSFVVAMFSFLYTDDLIGHLMKDVAARILSFSQKGPQSICILSANGAISNVTLRQPGSSGGTLTYEVIEPNSNSIIFCV